MRRVMFWALFWVMAAGAQLPHEVLVLANQRSADSLRVANEFVARRGIPLRNVVRLDVPEALFEGRATCDPAAFERWIWEPAQRVMVARGLEKQVLAWVYSTDFPIRVETDESDRRQVSICGYTFLRGRSVGGALVEEGKFQSGLFGGPNDRLRLVLPSCSLGVLKEGLGVSVRGAETVKRMEVGLGDKMPLPSMMLGYTGEGGSSVSLVLEVLERGVASDHVGVGSGFYFVTNGNVRSTCRAWQFETTQQQLARRGVSAVITNALPAGAEGVMGLLCGAERVEPGAIGSFAPGAVAEHLTSWSAEFQRPQTKCTAWLEAGATATCGSVVEPYANANKFPSARFFEHYVGGCSVLESFYQSVACPLQQLFLGDPLARPYAPRVAAKVLGVSELEGEPFRFRAAAVCRARGVAWRYLFLLDGELLAADGALGSVQIDPAKLADGYHALRCVVVAKHPVAFYGMAEKGITVNRLGRSIGFDGKIEPLGEGVHGFRAVMGGDELPERVRLLVGHEVLDEQPFDPEGLLRFRESAWGEGPCRLQLVGVFADGMEVASQPLQLTVVDPKP